MAPRRITTTSLRSVGAAARRARGVASARPVQQAARWRTERRLVISPPLELGRRERDRGRLGGRAGVQDGGARRLSGGGPEARLDEGARVGVEGRGEVGRPGGALHQGGGGDPVGRPVGPPLRRRGSEGRLAHGPEVAQEVAEGARLVSAGDLEYKVPITSRD